MAALALNHGAEQVDGLMLDPAHPRFKDVAGNDADVSILSIVQRDFAECISQISLFPSGCEELKADPLSITAVSQTNGMSRRSSSASWPSCSAASTWCGSTVSASQLP